MAAMANAITGLDHVIVGVNDLERARAGWQRLGFTLTPRGRHLGRRSGNCCIMFADDYVELLGVVDPSLPESSTTRFIAEHGAGLMGAAFATESAEASHAGFAAAGLAPLDIVDLGRRIEAPGGEAEVRFRLVLLPPERTAAFRLFVCHQLTPALAHHSSWLGHANGAVGLRGLTVAVPRPAALLTHYGPIVGLANTAVTDEMLTLFAGRHRLLFARPDDLATLFPETPPPADAVSPKGVALSFRVADLDRAAECLERAGVSFAVPFPGYLHVPPAEANGVIVEFAAT